MNKHQINSFYTYLESQQTAQRYLHHCYKKLVNVDVNCEVKSYENCHAFIYYLEHARKYYEAGKKSDIALQPVLLFYGMAHLLKASLLTIKPNYPESTTLLAHGVSTRKRKKKNYSFLEDEVKVQHNGLFPYFSKHLYNTEQIPFEKITMKSLLSLIPELHYLFQLHQEKKLVKIGKYLWTNLHFPSTLLDQYHLTKDSFIRRIETFLPTIQQIEEKEDSIIIHLNEPIQNFNGPFYLHSDQSIYFPALRENFIVLPEVMNHYLLLYNLSMISRYEAEWWGELLHSKSDMDYPLIKEFLSVTAEKVPIILGEVLLKNND